MTIEQVCSFLFGKANVDAVSYTFTKLSLVNPLYMGKGFTAKEMEHGKGWWFSKIYLVWSDFGFEGACESAVFDPSCMTDGLRPKRSGKGFGLEDLSSISNHQPSEVRLLRVWFVHSDTPFSCGV